MAFDDHRARPEAPPRNLRRVGVIAVVAAIAIAAFGILERRSHEAEVTQWTQEQAIPTTVAGDNYLEDWRIHSASGPALAPCRPGMTRRFMHASAVT